MPPGLPATRSLCPAAPPAPPSSAPQALSENGWLYDATLLERWYPNNPTSPGPNQLLYPYTMDNGIPQVRHSWYCLCTPLFLLGFEYRPRGGARLGWPLYNDSVRSSIPCHRIHSSLACINLPGLSS